MTDPLDRIADALDRIAPPRDHPADPLTHPAYVWQARQLVAARRFAPLPLRRLRGIDAQKAAVRDNLARLAAGHAAHDMLLWGARGAGKSALAKSAVADCQAAGAALALIDIAADALGELPRLFDAIDGVAGRAFVVFIDDLGFDGPGAARALRATLEGGIQARPSHARFIVTSNRRHLMPRDLADQATAVNARDAIDDELALADRFGLSLGFHALDQDGYLDIIAGYAADYGLAFDRGDALQWAVTRGARSGRVAWHYIVELAGRHGKSIETF